MIYNIRRKPQSIFLKSKLVKFAAAMLFHVCVAEEESILEDASVVDHSYFKPTKTPDCNEMIGDGFHSFIRTTNSPPSPVYFTIDFGASSQKKVRAVFINNLDRTEHEQ